MSRKVARMALIHPSNKGHVLSARIYPDTKKGCSCGSQGYSYDEIESYEFPRCANIECKKSPERFLIAANVIDPSGNKRREKIRHDIYGHRFSSVIDVLSTLKRIDQDIKSGRFDLKDYSSGKRRETFKFSILVNDYLEHNKNRLERGEITPGGLSAKKDSVKYLLPYFKDIDISLIDERTIRKFYDSFTDKFRARDLSVQELKTILKFAVNDSRLDKLPRFPRLSPAKMISSSNFLSIEEQERVISHIENPLYRGAIKALAIYALRPSEIRTLKWSDVDKNGEFFFVQSHLSKGVEVQGRKSQSEAAHKLPIIQAFEEVLKDLPVPLDSSSYVFKGEKGGVIGESVLNDAWKKACKKANVKQVSLYVGTKHSTLSYLAVQYTDAQLAELTGHSNLKTLRRYARSNFGDVGSMLEKIRRDKSVRTLSAGNDDAG